MAVDRTVAAPVSATSTSAARTPPSGNPLTGVDLALGLGIAATRVAFKSAGAAQRLLAKAEPLARQAVRPALPVVRQYWPEERIRQLELEGHARRVALTAALLRAIRAQVPKLLDTVLDEIDLTRLVTERVDLDEVARRIDVDALARKVDVDAMLDRVDVIGLARYVIAGVDLPEIVRESTGSMASEGVRGVRMQTIDADERVNRLVDRLLLRRQGRRTDAPSEVEPEPSPADQP